MAEPTRFGIEKIKRQAKAVDAYCAGLTYDQIGQALGISAKAAREDVEAAMEQSLMERSRNVDILIEEQLAVLTRMRRAAWPAAIQGDTRSQDMVLKVTKEISHLLRLDPSLNVNLEVSSIDAIDRQIQQLSKQIALEESQYEWEAESHRVQEN